MTGPWRCRASVPWLPHPVRCDESVVPMTAFCAEHYIAAQTSAAGKRVLPDTAPAADPNK